jgi:uncharacterized protein
MIEDVAIRHGRVRLAAELHLPAASEDRPVPAVVAGSGLGGVKEMLLPAFAAALAESGTACLLIDYVGFGASGGEPRQHVDPPAQIAAYRTALGALAEDRRIDPERLGVWGPSLAGAHSLHLAATDRRVRAAVAIVPFMGLGDDAGSPELVAAVLSDLTARSRGEVGRMVPLTGRPGELAAMTDDGAWAWTRRMTAEAPRFRNELTLASLVELASYRPLDGIERIDTPVRAIVATGDTITPADTVRERLAPLGPVDIVELPDTHFELFENHLAATVDATVSWFSTHLA